MTSEQFAYWLQGFAEIHGGAPTPEQWKVIKDHLNLVFNKVTPDRTQPFAPYPAPPLNPNPFNPNDLPPFPYSDGPICGGEPIWRIPFPGKPGEIKYCTPKTDCSSVSSGAPPYVEGYPVDIHDYRQGGTIPLSTGEPIPPIISNETVLPKTIVQSFGVEYFNNLSTYTPPISC